MTLILAFKIAFNFNFNIYMEVINTKHFLFSTELYVHIFVQCEKKIET